MNMHASLCFLHSLLQFSSSACLHNVYFSTHYYAKEEGKFCHYDDISKYLYNVAGRNYVK